MKKLLTILLVGGAMLPVMAQQPTPVGVGAESRYATDAYPGFDNEKEIVSPSKKEPRWFAWINGPNRDNAKDQFAYCQWLEQEEDWKKAAKHYDALVREWPTAPEAAKAQLRYAQILDEKLDEHEDAFEQYRYLCDFFSLQCDYRKMADEMYRLAKVMRQEGKTIVYFRFKNTVDVRRAFETCVLRAPGADWAPAAMLEIGDLREEEGKYIEAVKVYENLRNLHFGTDEARKATIREARARMNILDKLGYNRERSIDTAAFFKTAMTCCDPADSAEISQLMNQLNATLDEEAYKAAKFYDANTRTRRSAMSAYEVYLKEYPNGIHVEEVKARLEAMKEAVK